MCNLLQPSDTSSFLGPNFHLRTLFSNILNPSPSHSVRFIHKGLLIIVFFYSIYKRMGYKLDSQEFDSW
jgi:hypothetical protein